MQAGTTRPQAGIRAETVARDLLLLTLEAGPGNALSADLRADLLAALDRPGQAVVIRAAGRAFHAATPADLPDDDAARVPTLAQLCAAVAAQSRPVVVALHGAVLDAGAELAVAAQARVAATGTRIVFPGVGLGLPPRGGASQRLPRLVGAEAAVALLARGEPVDAEAALVMGLVDQVVEGDPLAAALALAANPPKRRADGLRDVAGFQAAIAAARRSGVAGVAARIVECIEAALYLPLENGLAMEAVAVEDLADSDTALALRYVARAERRAAVMPADVAQARPKAVGQIGVLGGGGQVPALVLVALLRGLSVRWADPDRNRLEAARAWIAARQQAEVQAGRLTPVQRDADAARLVAGSDLAAVDMRGAELILRTGPLPAGARGLAQVPQVVLGGADGALGLVLAPSSRISELAVPQDADPVQVAALVQVLRRLGLPPVLTGRMPVIGRRMALAGRTALTRLLDLGVPRRAVETALAEAGVPPPDLTDPAVRAPMREMGHDEIRARWLAALANEGFRLVDARVARHPSDIDHLLVNGHGFPRALGGPMHQAQRRGLLVLRVDLRAMARDDAQGAPVWAPHPLLDRLIGRGLRLSDLDAM